MRWRQHDGQHVRHMDGVEGVSQMQRVQDNPRKGVAAVSRGDKTAWKQTSKIACKQARKQTRDGANSLIRWGSTEEDYSRLIDIFRRFIGSRTRPYVTSVSPYLKTLCRHLISRPCLATDLGMLTQCTPPSFLCQPNSDVVRHHLLQDGQGGLGLRRKGNIQMCSLGLPAKRALHAMRFVAYESALGFLLPPQGEHSSGDFLLGLNRRGCPPLRYSPAAILALVEEMGHTVLRHCQFRCGGVLAYLHNRLLSTFLTKDYHRNQKCVNDGIQD